MKLNAKKIPASTFANPNQPVRNTNYNNNNQQQHQSLNYNNQLPQQQAFNYDFQQPPPQQQSHHFSSSTPIQFDNSYSNPQATSTAYYDPFSSTSNQMNNYNPTPNNNTNFNPIQPPPSQPNQLQTPTMFYPNANNPAANLFNNPMASMAATYGSALADQGKTYVSQNVDRWFSISKLKYYFAVDTNYVAKKLLLLLFPFFNKDWSVKYNQNEAVPPKLDLNAPDMYIPVMAYVTYILVVGIALGTQNKFSPEQLGINASSALGWFLIEIVLILISLQILNVKSLLKTFDIMAFCGYKYFGMILCLTASLLISSTGYLVVLIYTCISFAYFMIRNLRLFILVDANPNDYQANAHGNKRRIYLVFFIALLQPIFMWWLTRHLV